MADGVGDLPAHVKIGHTKNEHVGQSGKLQGRKDCVHGQIGDDTSEDAGPGVTRQFASKQGGAHEHVGLGVHFCLNIA